LSATSNNSTTQKKNLQNKTRQKNDDDGPDLSEAAKVLANALLRQIWVQATDEYFAADLGGTSRLSSLRVNHLVLKRVLRLSKNLVYRKQSTRVSEEQWFQPEFCQIPRGPATGSTSGY